MNRHQGRPAWVQGQDPWGVSYASKGCVALRYLASSAAASQQPTRKLKLCKLSHPSVPVWAVMVSGRVEGACASKAASKLVHTKASESPFLSLSDLEVFPCTTTERLEAISFPASAVHYQGLLT